MNNKTKILTCLFVMGSLMARAQIGEHRSDFSVGGNAGYVLSSINFTPGVPQYQHGGITGGFSIRYICEKYFKSICGIYGEVNYAKVGWKEKILDTDNNKVMITATGQPLAYQRDITYVQVPIFAHLAWGREVRGVNVFVNAGPQFGFYLGESTNSNFDPLNPPATDNERVNHIIAQDTMSVKNKLDYGIALGLGLEYSIPKVGHFLAEARYYYGLGNIYGSSKRDYFGTSNQGQIVFKLAYLFDLAKTKNVTRK